METPEELARRIAQGHAFDNHVVEKKEFEKEQYGTPLPITTREEFAQHVLAVLKSEETICCTIYSTKNRNVQSDVYYHPSTNTMIAVHVNPAFQPSAYRPDNGFEHFNKKVMLAAWNESRDIPIYNSINELAAEKEAETKLRVAIELRFADDKQKMQQRHQRELRNSGDLSADTQRQAAELRALEKQKDEDFTRYCREREIERKLRKDLEEQEVQRQRPQVDGPVLGGPRR